MKLHSLHNPKLFIDDTEVKSMISATFSDNGANQLQSLNAVISDPDLEDMPLMNKKVELFLNNGSIDSAPIFRGFINEFTPSDKSLTIRALDPRMFISGKSSTPIVIDDKDNYDGNTIVQFLIDYIENKVNSKTTVMTTDFLHEMDRPIFMTGIRSTIVPYDIIKQMLTEKIDDETELDRTNQNAIFDYFLDIIHGGEHSGITIRKKRALNSNADMSFSYGNGISALKYNERPPPSFALGTVEESGEQVIFEYGNAPLGVVGLEKENITGKSRGEVRENLISSLILEQEFTKEISLTCTKGYTLGIGNIIHIDVPKLNLNGNFAITGKNIKVGSSMSCTLRCNNKPILLSDYLN